MPCGQPDTPTPIIRDISISSSEIFRKGLLLDSCEFIRRDKRELPAARDWAVGDKNEMWRRVSGIPSTMAIRKSRGSGNLDSLHSAVEKNVLVQLKVSEVSYQNSMACRVDVGIRGLLL